jgi:replication-associated recombination protein RarA
VKLPDMSQDPWAGVQTVNGFAADELISTLQKSIRRGLAENAALAAYELFASGPEFEDQVWRRLQIISVEDVGFGRFDAPILIGTLDGFRTNAARESPDRLIYLIHAVRALALSPKDRTSDEMATWVREASNAGEAKPDVFPDAIDMHTARGAAEGRGFIHWFTQGAQVVNEVPDRDLTYRQRVLELLERDGHTS